MFEWDEEKNKTNLAKHGINFEEAALIFEGRVFSWTDNRKDYGEARSIASVYFPRSARGRGSHKPAWKDQTYLGPPCKRT